MKMERCGNDEMRTRRALRILPVICLILLCNSPGSSASWKASLDAPMDDVNAFWGQEFGDLCSRMNMPCGEERTSARRDILPGKSPKLHLKKPTPREVLAAIMRRYPGYHYVIRDGVLNLKPKKMLGEDLLGRKLDHVSIRGSSSLLACVNVLRQAKIKFGWSVRGDPHYARIDLELHDVTVREALNAIAKADGQVMWFFSHQVSKKGKDSGMFSLTPWRLSGGIAPFDENWQMQ